MNFLAHAYLSYGQSGIITGNMISDYVKGKRQFEFNPVIQKGIKLHRSIDAFTDRSEATRYVKSMFRERYRLFSGALADIVYDYFLANDLSIFSDPNQIQALADGAYRDLDRHKDELPALFIPVFSGMKSYNWLVNYQYEWGIQRSFAGLARRSLHIGETDTAFETFLKEKEGMRSAYADFFPELESFSRNMLSELMNE